MQVFQLGDLVHKDYPNIEFYKKGHFIASPFANCQTFSLGNAVEFFTNSTDYSEALADIQRYSNMHGRPQCIMDMNDYFWKRVKDTLKSKITDLLKIECLYENSNGSMMVLVLLQFPL